MDLPAGFGVSFGDRFRQPIDQYVDALGIPSDPRHVGTIADAAHPIVNLLQVHVGSHEPGDDDDRRSIAARNTKPVIDR
jgi:hypothetical protein